MPVVARMSKQILFTKLSLPVVRKSTMPAKSVARSVGLAQHSMVNPPLKLTVVGRDARVTH